MSNWKPLMCRNKQRAKKCKDCGKEYAGTPSSKYCLICKDKRIR